MSAAPTAARLARGTWQADAARAQLHFEVRNFGVHRVHGTFALTSAHVVLDDGGHPVRVEAQLDAASVLTGSGRRDADLRGTRFFDVGGFPALEFRAGPGSSSPQQGDERRRVDGELVVRGRSAPLTLQVEVTDTAADTVTVHATGVLDRCATPLRAPRLLIGRDVTIDVVCTLRRRPSD